jgi:hypothetical protein
MKTPSMNSPNKVNFVFRQQPKKTSKYGILLTYINQDEINLTRSDRILQPMSAFWLPFAYQRATDLCLEELQQIARSSIYQLKLHIQYLEDSFGLNTLPISLEPTQADYPIVSHHPLDDQGFGEVTEDFSNEDHILNRLV